MPRSLFVELFQLRGRARESEQLHHEERNKVQSPDEWLAMVAHDLRQPLTATSIGVANIFRHCSKSETPEVERIRQDCAVIQRAVVHMERMLGDLLDVARLDSGSFALQLAPYPMVDILGQAAELLSPIAAERNLRLELVKSASPCIVRCERDRILQALSNLVGNAIKCGHPKPRSPSDASCGHRRSWCS